MKQRLHLARGLVGEAKVLFLDEPTTGMDPLAAREFRALISELRAEGRTILLATHAWPCHLTFSAHRRRGSADRRARPRARAARRRGGFRGGRRNAHRGG